MSKLLAAGKGNAYLPIIVDADAGQEIKTAARDLAHMLWRITGAKFEIAKSCEGIAIRFAVDKKLEEEQFVIKIDACCGIKISGGSGQGVMYGIYALLEDVLGVRFYTHDVTKLRTIRC